MPAGRRGERLGFLASQRANRQGRTGQVICAPSPMANGNAAGRRRCRQLIELNAWIGRKHLDVCASSSDKLHLPDRRIAGAGHDDALAG